MRTLPEVGDRLYELFTERSFKETKMESLGMFKFCLVMPASRDSRVLCIRSPHVFSCDGKYYLDSNDIDVIAKSMWFGVDQYNYRELFTENQADNILTHFKNRVRQYETDCQISRANSLKEKSKLYLKWLK